MAAHERHVLLVGLDVSDVALYRRYREEMTPILQRYGGGFGYDFTIAETLRTESAGAINRVFTIFFPDREIAERFFTDEAYKKIRAATFEPAVRSVTTMASFDELRST